MSLTNISGERYELDRDGTVYSPNDYGICDGCGDDLDEDSEYFHFYGWLCTGCIDEMDKQEGADDDDD